MKVLISRDNPIPELFNLTADPYETTNLRGTLPEQADSLMAKMEEALADAVPEFDMDFEKPHIHQVNIFPLGENPRFGTNSVDWCFP